MNTLPTDVQLYQIALNLDLNDLQHFCQTERAVRNICSDDNFWHQKTIRDFGHTANGNAEPWRLIYIQEYEKKCSCKGNMYSSTCRVHKCTCESGKCNRHTNLYFKNKGCYWCNYTDCSKYGC